MNATLESIETVFTVSPWYREASFPQGKPIAWRRYCHVQSKLKEIVGHVDGMPVQVSVSQWRITVYDDKPRKFCVTECQPGRGFVAKSKIAALRGIMDRCDQTGRYTG